MKQFKAKKWLWMLAVISLMAALPSMARADDAKHQESTLTVNGQAEVLAMPDRALVNVGAEAQDKDAADAIAKVNSIMNDALRNIKKLGIDDAAIQTTQVNLFPVYENLKADDPGPANVVAYRANNSVQVTVDDLSLVGRVIDAANTAGANSQNGVDFQLKDDTAVKASALKLAAQQARTKAQALADALDVRLVEVRSVNESGVNIIRPYAPGPMMMRAQSAAETPVESGQMKIQANVVLVYVIEPR